jgi:DNA anti-recombination protein RmuC
MSTAPHHFEEIELIAEKAGELNDRVGKIENELGAQTKTLESAALVLDAAIKGLGALKSSVLENDLAAVQLSLNEKTAHLSSEVSRFEAAVSEIDRRAESGDNEIKAALLETAKSLRSQFEQKSAEVAEWGN